MCEYATHRATKLWICEQSNDRSSATHNEWPKHNNNSDNTTQNGYDGFRFGVA